MDCPVCESPMKEVERYGVDIDICPECKGVWLDRGEIENIAAVELQPVWTIGVIKETFLEKLEKYI